MTFRTPALACDADMDCAPLRKNDFSELPQEVLADARMVSEKEYGANQAKVNDLVGQLAALYLGAKQKDVMVIFNPGGWGWALVEQMPLWATILKGMKETLESSGRKVMIVDYLRTKRSLYGRIKEIMASANLSQAKGRELAARVEFMTRHLPNLQIILAGESNGAAMAEDAMRFLRDNPRVFSIQTGTPFWAPSEPFPRSLIINHNGIEPDSFSTGDARRWLIANVQALFGRYKGSQGNILLYIGAPGHVYNWGHTVVREKITRFLNAQKLASVTNKEGMRCLAK